MTYMERLVGVACLVISIIFLSMSFDLIFIQNENGSMGPGFFPRIIAGILVCLSIIYVYHLFKQKIEKREKKTDKIIVLKQVTLLILLSICIVLSNIIGMLFSIGLFLFFMLAVVQRTDWKLSVGICLLMLAIMYLLFEVWLGISLPKGLL